MAGEAGKGGISHTGGSGISIAIREDGAQQVTQSVEKLADAFESLSPKFAATLRGRALRLGVSLPSIVKKAASVMVDRVIRTTPHDTGRARAGWNVSIGAPDTSVTEETDYEGDQTIAKGQATIAAATQLAPGAAIYITNGLDYIEALDHGWSSQQAAGMVARAKQAGINSVKQEAKDVFK
jgi:hypothetical protein